MNIAILCGGKGTRISSVAKGLPKILIPIINKPFIYLLLDSLINNGITNIFLLTSYKGEEIKNEIGNEYKTIPITYINDNIFDKSGTASALLNALEILPDYFLLQYGDTILDINYRDFYKKGIKCKNKILMAIYTNSTNLDKNNVLYKKNKLRYLNLNIKENRTLKPNFIDYGLMGMGKFVLNQNIKILKENACLKYFQEKLSISNLLAPYVVYERFYEIGTPSSYEKFETLYKKGDLNHILSLKRYEE